ncbi:pleckstrin homology domain-containing protein 1-like [Gigantopelta aegis]|uniref:pleckstrin homology domain-containing protein 1-like n=1 Tax=Gigantopelta aegis TaxID=1735272 RepID=UPI001B88BE3E|nr:pleckstrin homology domain-containing protein 1-like [Gigantopelta aegis]
MNLYNDHEDVGAGGDSQSGWLIKRGRLTHRWRRRWFDLRNDVLLYGKAPEERSLKKKIVLEGALITQSNIDGKQFAFRIKSRENGRLHYICAENEVLQQEWMQAIYLARGVQGEHSQACVIQ